MRHLLVGEESMDLSTWLRCFAVQLAHHSLPSEQGVLISTELAVDLVRQARWFAEELDKEKRRVEELLSIPKQKATTGEAGVA